MMNLIHKELIKLWFETKKDKGEVYGYSLQYKIEMRKM